MTCGYESSGDTLIFQRCLSPSESNTVLLLNGKLNKFLTGGTKLSVSVQTILQNILNPQF